MNSINQTASKVSNEHYQKNLKFWEDAWLRVKKASVKIPDVLDYIPEIPKVFAEHNSKKILDIACGSGWLSFYLNEFGFEVVGVDISESAIKLANELLDEQKQSAKEQGTHQKLFSEGLTAEKIDISKLQFIQEDMFAMNFPENTFDGILINAAFEHLDYARGKEFLNKIKYILKPDAIMFGVFDKVASGNKGEFEVLADGTHQYNDQYRDGMFLRNYPDDELNALLADSKWEVLSLKKNSYESRIVVAANKK